LKYHCHNLESALTGIADVMSPTGANCTNEFLMKPDNDSAECSCNSLIGEIESDPLYSSAIISLCGEEVLSGLCDKLTQGGRYANFCASTTSTVAPPSASTNTSSGRRLHPPCANSIHGLAHSRWSPLTKEKGDCAYSRLTVAAKDAAHPRLESHRALTWEPHAILAKLSSDLPKEAGPLKIESAPPRALQSQSSSSTAATDGTTAWTVEEWSSCRCYAQCMPGLQTRYVSCGAQACKGPAPASERPCSCSHCASCEAVLGLEILRWIAVFQVVANCYLSITFSVFCNLPEEEMIRLGIGRKLAGLFCKKLPLVVQICTLAELGIIAYFMIITFVPQLTPPDSTWMKDCYQSPTLRLDCYLMAVHWVVRVIVGQIALRFTRYPPWLYTPRGRSQSFMRRKIMGAIHSMGPC